MSRRDSGRYWAYGLLGMPLAMVALPVYVQVPTYYASTLGVPLAWVGWVLFGARLIDTFQDLWLGEWIDSLKQRAWLRKALPVAAVVLAVFFWGLWQPATDTPLGLAVWLAVMLAVVYTAHSFLNIAYLAWGARLSSSPDQLTRAAASREGAGLGGVVLGSAGPPTLIALGWASGSVMTGYSALMALLLAAGLWLLLNKAPVWTSSAVTLRLTWRQTLTRPAFRRLLLPFFLNAFAVAIPATLALFFIQDRLRDEAWSGIYLGAYFLAGAIGLPLWTRLASRVGALTAWRIGMAAAVVAFVWATQLQAGDRYAYLLICLMAGLALGADLAMPPVLLACQLPEQEDPASYYGVWSLLGKLALAMSGLCLPMLAQLGYQPGASDGNTTALAWLYGGLPCVLKLAAWLSLGRVSDPTLRSI